MKEKNGENIEINDDETYHEEYIHRWDLHVHTVIGSPCANYDSLQIPHYANLENLDGIVITDHNFGWAADNVTVQRYDKLLKSFKEHGVLALIGMEVTCGQNDILIYPEDITAFVDKLPGGLGRMDFDVGEVVETADKVGALSVLAHPHSCPGKNEVMFDAIERYNGIRGVFHNPYGIPEVAGSDAHFPWGVGKALTLFPEEIGEISDIVRLVKEGRCRPTRKVGLNG
ncbi:MAG: PHP domain-containing protein [Deltaproteobacteria bacterium]|uniref:PHP domain-containing protein n=1 Tax=Candidatus Zymogenus saltonus TaxID=2844893 RepID=A0A9D8PS83_9DELT|nr:PHP domain-containing protein [Candidatus Zymogenus saltonus]